MCVLSHYRGPGPSQKELRLLRRSDTRVQSIPPPAKVPMVPQLLRTCHIESKSAILGWVLPHWGNFPSTPGTLTVVLRLRRRDSRPRPVRKPSPPGGAPSNKTRQRSNTSGAQTETAHVRAEERREQRRAAELHYNLFMDSEHHLGEAETYKKQKKEKKTSINFLVFLISCSYGMDRLVSIIILFRIKSRSTKRF